MRGHEPTIAYVTRRTAEGLDKREIIRCLNRYLDREIYHLLPPLDAIAITEATPAKLVTCWVAQYRSINAMAEALNSLLKAECIRNPVLRGTGWRSIDDVELAVATYVD